MMTLRKGGVNWISSDRPDLVPCACPRVCFVEYEVDILGGIIAAESSVEHEGLFLAMNKEEGVDG